MQQETIKHVTHVRTLIVGEISHLKVDGTEMTKNACIQEIESGIAYETRPPSILPGARIIVILDSKTEQKHLRTVADGTEENNLGGLPDF